MICMHRSPMTDSFLFADKWSWGLNMCHDACSGTTYTIKIKEFLLQIPSAWTPRLFSSTSTVFARAHCGHKMAESTNILSPCELSMLLFLEDSPQSQNSAPWTAANGFLPLIRFLDEAANEFGIDFQFWHFLHTPSDTGRFNLQNVGAAEYQSGAYASNLQTAK